MTDHAANIRAAIQAAIDDAGDGFQVAQFVVCMGLERISSQGDLESAPWLWAPPGQPEWMTDGLLEAADYLRCAAPVEDDQ